ncbi:MAG: iron complex outermembrane receptor protein [Bermanella sp.]|jgi:iron complex outermembrane receptor protein
MRKTMVNRNSMISNRSLVVGLFLVMFSVGASAQSEKPEESNPKQAEKPDEKPVSKARTRDIEEVIVTANRREQSVQDIASGIRVLDGEAMERNGISGMEDYVFSVPGVDFADSGLEKKIAVRGVANTAADGAGGGGASSPIGLYLDDTPIQGNGIMPDLALFDLQRMEVLKGPQGTLYGEGAMGGTIRMILNQPDPDSVAAKVELGESNTRNGGTNRATNVMLNVPLFGEWAMRLVGSKRHDAGFINYFNRGPEGEDENSSNNFTARAALAGNVTDNLHLNLMLLHQDQQMDNFNAVQFKNGDLRNDGSEPQFADSDLDLASATLSYDFDFATLTSSSSYFINERQALSRLGFLEPLKKALITPTFGRDFQAPTLEAENEWVTTDNHQRAFAQEIRLVSNSEGWINWVAGVFYRKRINDFDFLIDNDASDEPSPIGPGVVGEWGRESFEQKAVFGELTLRLLSSLELTVGARSFREEVGLSATAALRGPLYAAGVTACSCVSGESSSEYEIETSATTPKLTLSWFIDDQRMVYLNIAEGVRSGGTNPIAASTTATPFFEPDRLWSYEIGAKTQWWDGLLLANLSLFELEWTDMQVQTTEPAQAGALDSEAVVILNVGEAVNKGAELELGLNLIDGLVVGANFYWSDGEIVKGDTKGMIPAGSALPQQSDFSWSANVTYRPVDFNVFGFSPFVTVNTNVTGDRAFRPETIDYDPSMDGFQTWDAIVGASNNSFSLSVGVKNITDERYQLGNMALDPDTYIIGRPRTVDLRLSYTY